jgi:hypothetical protein
MLLTQRITRNPILCGGPTEYFSKKTPAWHPKTPDENELKPIDVLYGHYDPTNRSIEIFVNRIHQDASTFGAEPNELCEVVRIHEHAHAVAHLGSRFDDVHDHLSVFGQDKRTDWSEFLEQRTSWFNRFPIELHEFLAQGITYAALHRLSVPGRSERLRAVFEALELKQPSHYRLTPIVRKYADKADWTLILDAVRGTIDAYRERDFLLSTGIEALVESTAK